MPREQRVEQLRPRAEVGCLEPSESVREINQPVRRSKIENAERAHHGKALGARRRYACAVIHQNEIGFQQLRQRQRFGLAFIQCRCS